MIIMRSSLINNILKEMINMDPDYTEIKNAWDNLVNTVREIIGTLVESVDQLINDIKEAKQKAEEGSKNKRGWHVPLSTVKHSQVMNRQPVVSCIRNTI